MSIPYTLASVLVVPLIAMPASQAQAPKPMPSYKLDVAPTLNFAKHLSKRPGVRGHNYKEAGKPGHDPIILRIAPYDIDWA